MSLQKKPIKRDKSLQPLSRDHHHGLLLCWKIRTGLKKNIEVKRIKDYSNWFYKNSLRHHFEDEEKLLFPLMDEDNDLIKKALGDHRRLRRLFEDEQDVGRSLSLIEEELDAHIRFEERVLFNDIQEAVGKDKLEEVNRKLHPEVKDPDAAWHDHFWK